MTKQKRAQTDTPEYPKRRPSQVKDRRDYYPSKSRQDTEGSLTHQSFKDACDINMIVKNHTDQGFWSHQNPRQPMYGDFTMAVELQEALGRVDAAHADFESLPADVREAAANDPVRFLEMTADEEGFADLVEAGMAVGKDYELPESRRAEVSDPPAATPQQTGDDPAKSGGD